MFEKFPLKDGLTATINIFEDDMNKSQSFISARIYEQKYYLLDAKTFYIKNSEYDNLSEFIDIFKNNFTENFKNITDNKLIHKDDLIFEMDLSEDR